MQKTNVKKLVAVVSAAAVCFSTAITPVLADIKLPAKEGTETVIPFNIAINTTYNEFTINSNGNASCYATTGVRSGYKAYVYVELQKDTGSWNTIKTWSATATSSASVDKTYSVSKGYDYRLKITHKAYDSNGNTVETITKYSDTVTY